MLYGFENFMAPEFFQTWCARVRDQSTMQLIAGATLQHQVMHSIEEVVESGAEFVEHEMEIPFLPPTPVVSTQRRATRGRGNPRTPANPRHH